MKSRVLADEILKLLESKKAEDIVLIDISKKVDYADFLIICSAHSTKHTQGLADYITFELEKLGIRPLNVEGFELGQWIVVDFDSVILHIFYEPIRKVYALEELWMDYSPSQNFQQKETENLLQKPN